MSVVVEYTSPRKGEVGAQRRVGIDVTEFDRTRGKTARARRLRRDATDAERHLWQRLRQGQVLGVSFRRQHPVGPYVLDFYCSAARLAIELDGSQHGCSEQVLSDKVRSEFLCERGIRVVRFWNHDVLGNVEGVLEMISEVLSSTPTLTLPLSGGGEHPLLRREIEEVDR